MHVAPDFSEAPEQTCLPTGEYKARIIGGEVTRSSGSDKPMIKWELEIFDAEGDKSRYNTWKVRTNTMLSGPAAGRLRDLYQAAMDAKMPDAGFDSDELLGKEVKIITSQRDYNGRTYADVKAVRKI